MLEIILIGITAYALYRIGREHGEIRALEESNKLLDEALEGKEVKR